MSVLVLTHGMLKGVHRVIILILIIHYALDSWYTTKNILFSTPPTILSAS